MTEIAPLEPTPGSVDAPTAAGLRKVSLSWSCPLRRQVHSHARLYDESYQPKSAYEVVQRDLRLAKGIKKH